MEKQAWQTPILETLDVGETAAGIGITTVDFTYVNGDLVDMDIYDPS